MMSFSKIKESTGFWRKVAGAICLVIVLGITFLMGLNAHKNSAIFVFFVWSVTCDSLLIFAIYFLGNYRLVKSGLDEPINKPKK